MFKLHHIDIWINKIEESIKFYELLGFSKIKEIDNKEQNKKIILMELDDLILEMKYHYENKCIHNKANCNDNKVFGLSVKDIQKSIGHIKSNNLTNEKINIKEGILGQQYFLIHDPNGILIEIIEEK